MGRITGYIGTYPSGAAGLYRFTLDAKTGALSAPALFFAGSGMKCAAVSSGGSIAAPIEKDGCAGAVLLSPGGEVIGGAMRERAAACYAVFHGGFLYTANYHEGRILRYDEKALSPAGECLIAPGAGCHQVLFHRGLALVPCLTLDRIELLDERTLTPVGAIPFPAGSGPRHGVFDRAHSKLYVVCEHDCTLHTLSTDGGFKHLSCVPIIEAAGNAAAAILLSPDGTRLYCTVRGADVIAVFDSSGDSPKPIQHVPSGGRHPRDAVLAAGGMYLLCINRDTDSLASFQIEGDGRLSGPVSEQAVPKGTGIALEEAIKK